jgi:hypothetical protein
LSKKLIGLKIKASVVVSFLSSGGSFAETDAGFDKNQPLATTNKR